MDYCRAHFQVDWMFLERFVPFFLKVVLVMDSGCSLRGTLRALRDRSAATTLAQTLLSPTLLDAFSKNSFTCSQFSQGPVWRPAVTRDHIEYLWATSFQLFKIMII